MKKQTLVNRLAELEVNKNTVAYRNVLATLEGKTLLRPCYTSGSGRYITNQDHTDATATLLSAIGIKFEKGNDAERGGKTGNFIKITTKITE